MFSIAKDYTKSLKSSNNTDNEEDQYKLIDFYIIGSRIIPKS